ncbi:MAG: 1-deoxy-D-xylulose-5-phosphate reductoisomerase [Acidobacteria bacterium]|nr:1-deoxy-D-xylulose-5-phosphate reductoisomerase [Acidobacteriota bacterium]
MTPRRLAVLGATGSVGETTLAVARLHPDRLRVAVLAAQGSRPERLVELAREFRPKLVVVADADAAGLLRAELPTGVALESGEDALLAAVGAGDVDLVVTAIVGAAGLQPAAAALEAGADLALANKEAMVAAGPVLRRLAAASGASILPIDSEHAAIHQALRAGRPREVRRLVLTASGGPFLERDPATLEAATPAEATAHPTWDMGAKISVDSATLMNKGLELIEASYLFDVDGPRIDILIHPQSLVHSIVEFRCGNGVAQISANDMRYPIQYALSYPERWARPAGGLSVDLSDLLLQTSKLEFSRVDPALFPAPSLARNALTRGGGATAVMNAANEIAVDAFLGGRAPFTAIVPVVSEVLERHARQADVSEPQSIKEALAWDSWGRRQAREVLAASGG